MVEIHLAAVVAAHLVKIVELANASMALRCAAADGV